MRTSEYKAECVLRLDGRDFPGLAHVIEVEYDDVTTFVNFSMQSVFGAMEELRGIVPSKRGTFHLPDGRRASVCPPNILVGPDYFCLTGAGVLFDANE